MTGTIGPKRYRILFFGAFAPHLARVDAAAVLKQMLRVPDDQLAACLSGRKVALRKDLDERAARQWSQRLREAGLEVTVDPPLPAQAATTPISAPPAAATERRGTPGDDSDAALPQPARRRIRATTLITAGTGLTLCVVVILSWQRWLTPKLADWRAQRHLEAAMLALAPVEAEINGFFARTGFLPNHPLDMGKPDDSLLSTDIIERLSLGQSGQLTLTFSHGDDVLAAMTLILSPARKDDGAGFSWHCAGGTLPASRWPRRCQQQVVRHSDGGVGPRLSDLPSMAGLDQVELPSATLPAMEAADPVTRILAQIIDDTLDLRLKALRHYMETLAWPTHNDAVGLPPGHQLAGKHMRHLKFIDDGRIEVRFDDSLPALAGHRFWLRPTMPGQWACESTLADDQLPVTCKTPIK